MSKTLVPSCGVLFGGYINNKDGNDAFTSLNNFNAANGTQLDVVHDYRVPGQTLSSHDIAAAQTPGDVLQLNWKPAYAWADADGGNASVNSQIDAMAASVKSLGSTKIMLSIFHEPENDVTSGADGCASSVYKGSAGTPDQYRAMWANVESRFAADGVTNAVWVMNYMGFSGWNCMVDDLWPGNSLVDWILWDPYTNNSGATYSQTVSSFYTFLTQNSDADHDYLDKPWGLGEYGTHQPSQAEQEQYYLDMKSAIDNDTFPKLELYSLFDDPDYNVQVAYDYNGKSDPQELANFVKLANDKNVLQGNTSAMNPS